MCNSMKFICSNNTFFFEYVPFTFLIRNSLVLHFSLVNSYQDCYKFYFKWSYFFTEEKNSVLEVVIEQKTELIILRAYFFLFGHVAFKINKGIIFTSHSVAVLFAKFYNDCNMLLLNAAKERVLWNQKSILVKHCMRASIVLCS